ncbi:Splicing factor-like protein [Trema orientale]|uniref:Splicing factor-like protein n=1 Tax=Trema orientale TaxID=63057 RepID=A0A2P5F0Y3_TREOI|nr:Splicing factor-like protein [Trema orientale]
MVLSNKKLKQKLRAELAESLAASVAKPDSNNNGSANPERDSQIQPPKSLKVLLDSETQRPRLSKREKRRKTVSLRGPEAVNPGDSEEKKVGEEDKKENGPEGLREKKRKRKREGNEDEKDGVSGSEENGAEKREKKSKKNKNKKKQQQKKKRKKAKNEEDKEKEKENTVAVADTEANGDNDSNQANGNVSTKVYVGGIPYYSTEDDIRSYFEGCGTITEVDCMTFPESGKFRGIAIVSFKTEAAAKRALAFNGADMGGLFLTIQPYKTNRTKKSSDFAPQAVEGYNRIYVGNLSWDVTEDKLRNFFSDCKISSIRFGMDKETGEFRGYAHVDFSDNLSLALALKLNQKHFCDRPVKISYAVPLKKAVGTKSRPVPTTRETTESRIVPTTAETTDSYTGVTSTSTGKMKRRTCLDCGEKGHISSDCPKKQTAISTTTETTNSIIVPTTTETTDSNTGVTSVSTGKMKRRSCYDCGEKGHISSDCPKKQTAISTTAETTNSIIVPTTTETTVSNTGVTSVSSSKLKRRTCYDCGEKGHISSDCPKKQAVGSTKASGD